MKKYKFLRIIDENLKTLICRWVTTFERMKSREAEHLKNFLSDIDLEIYQVQEYYRTNDHSPVIPDGKIGLGGPRSGIKTLESEILDEDSTGQNQSVLRRICRKISCHLGVQGLDRVVRRPLVIDPWFWLSRIHSSDLYQLTGTLIPSEWPGTVKWILHRIGR